MSSGRFELKTSTARGRKRFMVISFWEDPKKSEFFFFAAFFDELQIAGALIRFCTLQTVTNKMDGVVCDWQKKKKKMNAYDNANETETIVNMNKTNNEKLEGSMPKKRRTDNPIVMKVKLGKEKRKKMIGWNWIIFGLMKMKRRRMHPQPTNELFAFSFFQRQVKSNF